MIFDSGLTRFLVLDCNTFFNNWNHLLALFENFLFYSGKVIGLVRPHMFNWSKKFALKVIRFFSREFYFKTWYTVLCFLGVNTSKSRSLLNRCSKHSKMNGDRRVVHLPWWVTMVRERAQELREELHSIFCRPVLLLLFGANSMPFIFA